MTIDVNVQSADEAFLEDIDEIIEDTMVQIFVLQPKDIDALTIAKEHARRYDQIFYVSALGLREQCDDNCVGYRIDSLDELQDGTNIDKVLFVDESLLEGTMIERLKDAKRNVIVMNATQTHDGLDGSFIAIGPNNVKAFGANALASISMDRIVLQSAYPDFDFDEIFTSVQRISDVLFRPEQSIIARATKSSLRLFGLNKR